MRKKSSLTILISFMETLGILRSFPLAGSAGWYSPGPPGLTLPDMAQALVETRDTCIAAHYFFADASGGVARAPRAGLGGKRSHGWRSAAGVQRAEARMAAANVRRWGMGNPDPPKTPMLQNMTG
jgi:hypothetical protein